MTQDRKATDNKGFAIAGVPCFADTFVVNQSLVLRINICGENRHLRQALTVENTHGKFLPSRMKSRMHFF
jgi:hypothetical protein